MKNNVEETPVFDKEKKIFISVGSKKSAHTPKTNYFLLVIEKNKFIGI